MFSTGKNVQNYSDTMQISSWDLRGEEMKDTMLIMWLITNILLREHKEMLKIAKKGAGHHILPWLSTLCHHLAFAISEYWEKTTGKRGSSPHSTVDHPFTQFIRFTMHFAGFVFIQILVQSIN